MRPELFNWLRFSKTRLLDGAAAREGCRRSCQSYMTDQSVCVCVWVGGEGEVGVLSALPLCVAPLVDDVLGRPL